MIEARSTGFNRLADRLTKRAARVVEIARRNRALARRQNPDRWRRAELLWPHFTGDH